MAFSVSMILTYITLHIFFSSKKKRNEGNLRKPKNVNHKGAASTVLELVSPVTFNITLDFSFSTTCCKSYLQDHLGSFRARMELRHTRRVPPSCKRTVNQRGRNPKTDGREARNIEVNARATFCLIREVVWRDLAIQNGTPEMVSLSSRTSATAMAVALAR